MLLCEEVTQKIHSGNVAKKKSKGGEHATWKTSVLSLAE